MEEEEKLKRGESDSNLFKVENKWLLLKLPFPQKTLFAVEAKENDGSKQSNHFQSKNLEKNGEEKDDLVGDSKFPQGKIQEERELERIGEEQVSESEEKEEKSFGGIESMFSIPQPLSNTKKKEKKTINSLNLATRRNGGVEKGRVEEKEEKVFDEAIMEETFLSLVGDKKLKRKTENRRNLLKKKLKAK